MTDQPRIPEDYPGVAQTDRGTPVTSMETKPLDDGEHLLRIWTADDELLELALTPTQVRQWASEFDVCELRVDIRLTREQPALDDTVLTSIVGKSFHSPAAKACAAVNAPDTAIEDELTVREAVQEGYEPCRHCYEFDGWGPDDLLQEVRFES